VGNRDVVHQVVHGIVHSLSTTFLQYHFMLETSTSFRLIYHWKRLILDFYSACNGVLLFDIAITANDWCGENGAINPDKITALLSGYESLRPLEQLEKQHWQTMLRAAALRFWLSRLEHQLYPRPGDIIQQKDPLIFRRLLQQHRQQNITNLFQPKALPSCFQPVANSRRQINSGGSICDTDYKTSF